MTSLAELDAKTRSYSDAIASVESDGSGGYSAVGPDTGKGRAYGRYQVMDFNIGPWTREVLGREMTPEEFVASPQAQDAVFGAKFGSYVQRYGNPQDAASMWFSGRPMAEAGNASDGYTTVPEYVNKFNNALGAPRNAFAEGAPQPAPQQQGMDLNRLSMLMQAMPQWRNSLRG